MQVTTWKWINLIHFHREHDWSSALDVILVRMVKALLKNVLQNAAITFSNVTPSIAFSDSSLYKKKEREFIGLWRRNFSCAFCCLFVFQRGISGNKTITGYLFWDTTNPLKVKSWTALKINEKSLSFSHVFCRDTMYKKQSWHAICLDQISKIIIPYIWRIFWRFGKQNDLTT